MVKNTMLFVGVALGALVPSISHAQSADANIDEGSGGVAEIIVTAQRRSENLQDVPIAITAVAGDSLDNLGVSATNDLPTVVPGLLIQKTGQAVTPFLRGVGSQAQNPGNDPSIATYVDGVYQSVPFSGIYALNDIERIEVLKGPQGTLFGRNATGGLINIVTKDPGAGLSGNLRLGYANYNTVDVGAYLAGGSDQLAASLSVNYKNQMDGWGKNIATPAGALPLVVPPPRFDKAGFLMEFSVAAKIRAQLGDNTKVTLAARYFENEGDQGEYRRGLDGARLLGGYVFPGGFWDEASDLSYVYRGKQYSVSGEVVHDFGSVTFKSITSYTDYKSVSTVPSDSTPIVTLTTVQAANVPVETFTQEFQLLSNGNGPLKWILGAYYLDSKSGYLPTIFGQGALAPSLLLSGSQKTKSMAGFAQTSYEFGTGTTITAGIRYTEDKFVASQYFEGQRPSFPVAQLRQGVQTSVVPDQRTTQGAWTYKASIDHRFSSEVLAYASYSRGFKSGGFNIGGMCLDVPANIGNCVSITPPVKPETIDAFEVGLKNDLFDRKLRLNLSGFYYDYKNLQLQITVGNPPVSVLTNAAAAKIYGGELEGQAVLGNLHLNFSAGLLHTEYTSFPNGPVFVPVAAPGGGNVQLPNQDFTGNKLSRSPKFTASIGATYTIPASFGNVEISGNYYHNSGFVWEPSNRLQQKSYDLLSGQLAVNMDGNLSISIWGRNLTNKKYYSFVKLGTDGDQGSPAAPRTFGATLGYKF